MNLYENMLPKQPKPGHLGYYPITSKEEWDELPAVYKAMDWEPVKDPNQKGALKAVKAVIFDVTYMQPYGIRAKVSVHPQEVQNILFCSFRKYDCHLYSVCGIELEGGTRLPAKWLQDTTTGAFAIYSLGNCVGRQGGFRGHIPAGIQRLEDGTFQFDFQKRGDKVSHFSLSNPFAHLSEEYVWEEKKEPDESKESLSTKIGSASARSAASERAVDGKQKGSPQIEKH